MSKTRRVREPMLAMIDSTTVAQLGQAFAIGHERLYDWARGSISGFTMVLIGSEDQYLAPSPVGLVGGKGLWQDVDTSLRSMSAIRSYSARNSSKSNARKRTVDWALKHTAELRTAHGQLVQDEQNGQRWARWVKQNQWLEHSQRLGHLFEKDFIPPIARAMQVTQTTLRGYWEESAKPTYVAKLVKEVDSLESRDISRAFLMSTLLRGVYYDYLARCEKIQIMHHPIRQKTILRSRAMDKWQHYGNGVDKALANIIVYSAMDERTPRGRIKHWAANVKRAREMRRSGHLMTAAVADESVCIDNAKNICRTIGLEVRSPVIRRVEQVLPAIAGGAAAWWATAIGLDAYTPVLRPVLSISAAAMAKALYHELKRPIVSDGRLEDLAHGRPGRLV